MTQSELNQAVSHATGDDCDVIDRRGFSLVEETPPLEDDDLLALITDWQRLEDEHEAARQRQSSYASIA